MTRAGEQTRMRLGSSGESRSGTRHVRTQTRKTTRGACARRREKRRVARANADAKRRIPSLGARKRPSTLERRRILSRTPGFVPRGKLLPRWTAIPTDQPPGRGRPSITAAPSDRQTNETLLEPTPQRKRPGQRSRGAPLHREHSAPSYLCSQRKQPSRRPQRVGGSDPAP